MDLEPQNKFENLTSAVERLTALTHKFSGIEKLDETAWTAYLCEHDADVKGTFANDLLDEEERNKSVQWFCSKNFISMTLQLPLSEIELTTTGINSSLLRGTWWGGVSRVETFEVGGLTQFNLDVDGDWPYLIRGGNPDGTSCYFLACIAQSLDQPEFVRMWLLHGAIRESRTAMTSYATLLYDANQVAAGCHWLSRCVLRFGDDQCAFLLAMLLLNPSVKYDTGLAEALLCSCCRNGFPRAFFQLGRLYLNGAPGVVPMPEKAQLLFQIAAVKFQDTDAQAMLDTVDFSQRPAEDVERTEESPDDAPARIDWAIAAVVIAGAVAAGYLALRSIRAWMGKRK